MPSHRCPEGCQCGKPPSVGGAGPDQTRGERVASVNAAVDEASQLAVKLLAQYGARHTMVGLLTAAAIVARQNGADDVAFGTVAVMTFRKVADAVGKFKA